MKILPQRGWWHNNDPFRELSGRQIAVVVVAGTAIAIAVVVALLAIVSSLPIPDTSKYGVLFGLGLASLVAGYWALTRKWR